MRQNTAESFPMIAALDLGSNSFHMVLARTSNGEMRILERLGEKVQLAAGIDVELVCAEGHALIGEAIEHAEQAGDADAAAGEDTAEHTEA